MPASERVHSKLLIEAARALLRPLGLAQKGRSRIWLDDNGWWLCVVEFQPSDWARGSYLNVGCTWLWAEKDYLSFDEGHRVENFSEFHDENQFQTIATSLAARAATEVKRYRSLFRTVKMVSDHYLSNKPDGFWPSFHAAIACGVAGRSSAAREFFRHVSNSDDNRAWVRAAQAEAALLHSVVNDSKTFRDIVTKKVVRTRQLLKLPTRGVVIFEESP